RVEYRENRVAAGEQQHLYEQWNVRRHCGRDGEHGDRHPWRISARYLRHQAVVDHRREESRPTHAEQISTQAHEPSKASVENGDGNRKRNELESEARQILREENFKRRISAEDGT